MPYFLRDQPESVELVIVHFGVDVRMSRLMRIETQTTPVPGTRRLIPGPGLNER